MKRLGIVLLVFIFVMGTSCAAFAEPAQIASAVIEEGLNSDIYVRITADLTGNWSVRFYPLAFYLYDQPAYDNEAEFLAYGTLLSEESYTSLVESIEADEKLEQKDGYSVYTTTEGLRSYIAPIEEGLYLLLLVDPAVDTDAVWARISFETESYGGFEYAFSERYTDEDMSEAMSIVVDRFKQWKGCTLDELWYAGDACNSEENIAWLNEIAGDKGFTECLEILIDFHTSNDPDELEDMVFEPDYYYSDYQWWLARTDGGDWELVSQGY